MSFTGIQKLGLVLEYLAPFHANYQQTPPIFSMWCWWIFPSCRFDCSQLRRSG